MYDFEVELVRGNTPEIKVTAKDSTGTIVDLTGYNMKMSVKNFAEDSDANAVIGPLTATIAFPSTGVGIFYPTTSDTDVPSKEYVWDVKIDNGTDRHTIVGPSKFTIIENVTKG